MSFIKYNISLHNFTKQEKFRKNNLESFFEPPISNSYLKGITAIKGKWRDFFF